ncbi:MAG: uncharacterized protein QOF78_617 [Phycisphaerales bacterium]|nr:uncharacterized protein [Phycisphaerales bacterium]
MFTADWLDVIFVHFRVDPARLQPLVPLPLDLHDGDAYVSLVAFTQSNLRPARGGWLAALLAAPLAHHEFLNVRTYVRQADASGIFFMAEWIPNRLAAFVGPRTYGLPYRLGRLKYQGMRREIEAEEGRLTIQARGMGAAPMSIAAPAAGRRKCTGGAPVPRGEQVFDDFLLERYTAFTHRHGVTRRFDVEHAPWSTRPVAVELCDSGLLALSGDWLAGAELAAAHHSHGVRDVAISWPRRVAGGTASAISAQ